MPRNVNPRWGMDGYSDPEPLTVSSEDAKALAETLDFPCNDSNVEKLRTGLAEIGSTYRRWHKQGAAAFSRAEAHAALQEALSLNQINYATVSALNERALHLTLDQLYLIVPSPVPPGTSFIDALVADQIDEQSLRQAITNAISQLKNAKGADRKGVLAYGVSELCLLYEELTGKPATHWNKRGRLYSPDPQSAAGQFVRACFRMIDPEIKNHMLVNALRVHVETHRC